MIVRNPADRATFRADKMGKTDLVIGNHLFVGLNSFEAGQKHEPHTHCDRDKLYMVLEGEGDLTIGEESGKIGPGDLALAPADVVHSLENPGPGRLIVMTFMAPPPSSIRS